MAQSLDHTVDSGSRLETWDERSQASHLARLWLSLSPFFFTLVIGCTSETDRPVDVTGSSSAESGNRPPVIERATVLPNPILLNGSISVQIEAEDPDRNPLTFRHQWFVNGNPLEGEIRPTLTPGLLKRGDKVHAEVVASDGQTEAKPFQTASVAVGNTPPDVTNVTIEPAGSGRGQFRAVVEGFDVDHDDIHYLFRWRRNRTVVLEGDYPELDTKTFVRGDSITVEITPRDAHDSGKPKLSQPLALGNNAPIITSHPPSTFEKGLFSYLVQAADEDKDSLKYELVVAPSGMTIDPMTGVISWQIGADVKGKYRVRVSVLDGQGGSAFQDFEISLSS